MKLSKRHTIFFLMLMPLVIGVTNLTPLIQAATYNIIVEVSSPIQNKTYYTNNIPLSFNYSTNITDLPNIAEYSVVFCYNLDGEPNFDIFGNPVFWGETTRIGQFYQPVPLDYNSSIHVSNGNHSLFVLVTFWITPEGEYHNTLKAHNVSQVIDFAVSSPTPPAEPKTIVVPDDYPTIQGAIDYASESDTVFVKNGIYYENVIVDKSIILIGENRETTIIDGDKKSDVIKIVHDRVNLTGFTLQNAFDPTYTQDLVPSLVGGIKIVGAHYCNIIGNILKNNTQGILLHGSTHNLISSNIVTYNTDNGIFLYASANNNTISENNVTNNPRGIRLQESVGFNTFYGNNIDENSIAGILHYRTSFDNSFVRNNITTNNIGVQIGGSARTIFHHNNFMNNAIQVSYVSPLMIPPLIWDNGEEGNYWDDYNGTDNNRDAIGDTPHIINENNQDNYPLMELYIGPEYPSPPTEAPWATGNFFPEPNSVDVPLDTNVSITFGRPPSIVELTISPEVAISQQSEESWDLYGAIHTFYFSELLEPSTTYTITIVYGTPNSTKTWNFTTSNQIPAPPTTDKDDSVDPTTTYLTITTAMLLSGILISLYLSKLIEKRKVKLAKKTTRIFFQSFPVSITSISLFS